MPNGQVLLSLTVAATDATPETTGAIVEPTTDEQAAAVADDAPGTVTQGSIFDAVSDAPLGVQPTSPAKTSPHVLSLFGCRPSIA